MYSRVTLVEIDMMRSSLEEALELYTERVLPQLREQEGFEGVVLMATPEGKGIVISLWETAEQAKANEETGFYSDTLTRFVTLFASPPGRESYEVVYADVPAVAVR
jgi:heme-degrading monooxygenase HmoA